jgi:phosphomannomutase
LDDIRKEIPSDIAGLVVHGFDDLMKPSGGLPPTNGLRFFLDNHVRVIIRPSGTEPKVKCYIEVVCKNGSESERQQADELVSRLMPALTGFFQ